MASSERWHTARRWAGIACCLVCSITAVSAQDGCWERMTAAGVQAFEQGDYAEEVRQFQAALPLADAADEIGVRLEGRFLRLTLRSPTAPALAVATRASGGRA